MSESTFSSEDMQEKISLKLDEEEKRKQFIRLVAELHRLLDSIMGDSLFITSGSKEYERFKDIAAPLFEVLDNDNDTRMRLVSLVSDMLATGCSDDELAEMFSAHVVSKIQKYIHEGTPPPLFYLCALDSVLMYGEKRAGQEVQRRFLGERILSERRDKSLKRPINRDKNDPL